MIPASRTRRKASKIACHSGFALRIAGHGSELHRLFPSIPIAWRRGTDLGGYAAKYESWLNAAAPARERPRAGEREGAPEDNRRGGVRPDRRQNAHCLASRSSSDETRHVVA